MMMRTAISKVSVDNFTFSELMRSKICSGVRKFSTYPAFISSFPVTEVTQLTNGVRVASEVTI